MLLKMFGYLGATLGLILIGPSIIRLDQSCSPTILSPITIYVKFWVKLQKMKQQHVYRFLFWGVQGGHCVESTDTKVSAKEDLITVQKCIHKAKDFHIWATLWNKIAMFSKWGWGGDGGHFNNQTGLLSTHLSDEIWAHISLTMLHNGCHPKSSLTVLMYVRQVQLPVKASIR